jgi:hypothetical protein
MLETKYKGSIEHSLVEFSQKSQTGNVKVPINS